MGAKINKIIFARGSDPKGTNFVSLPFRHPYMNFKDICDALGLDAVDSGADPSDDRAKVTQHNAAGAGGTCDYTCGDAGVGCSVPLGSFLSRVGIIITGQPLEVNGILVGSHAAGPPGVTIHPKGAHPKGSNMFPVLFHGTAATAADICSQLGLDSVNDPPAIPDDRARVTRKTAGGIGQTQDYDCGDAGVGYTLVLGEAVEITLQPLVIVGVVPPHF
jgi:hypothetical protein